MVTTGTFDRYSSGPKEKDSNGKETVSVKRLFVDGTYYLQCKIKVIINGLGATAKFETVEQRVGVESYVYLICLYVLISYFS